MLSLLLIWYINYYIHIYSSILSLTLKIIYLSHLTIDFVLTFSQFLEKLLNDIKIDFFKKIKINFNTQWIISNILFQYLSVQF